MPPKTISVLMYCAAGRAYTYAKSGKYPWEKYPIVRRLRDASGLYRGEIVPVKWVAVPQEPVSGVLVEWILNGKEIYVSNCGEPQFVLHVAGASTEDTRAIVGEIIGRPDQQARLWYGRWKFLKELPHGEIQRLAALAGKS